MSANPHLNVSDSLQNVSVKDLTLNSTQLTFLVKVYMIHLHALQEIPSHKQNTPL